MNQLQSHGPDRERGQGGTASVHGPLGGTPFDVHEDVADEPGVVRGDADQAAERDQVGLAVLDRRGGQRPLGVRVERLERTVDRGADALGAVRLVDEHAPPLPLGERGVRRPPAGPEAPLRRDDEAAGRGPGRDGAGRYRAKVGQPGAVKHVDPLAKERLGSDDERRP